jgi:hypothetical protein
MVIVVEVASRDIAVYGVGVNIAMGSGHKSNGLRLAMGVGRPLAVLKPLRRRHSHLVSSRSDIQLKGGRTLDAKAWSWRRVVRRASAVDISAVIQPSEISTISKSIRGFKIE